MTDCKTIPCGKDMACDGTCGKDRCKRCLGTGNELYLMFRLCKECNGTGHAGETLLTENKHPR